MILQPKIYVAGHRGMVGSAILRYLQNSGHSPENIITQTHEKLDLTNQADVQAFFKSQTPDEVYLAAAKVGGIYANNTYPAQFIYENLMIQNNVIDAAFRSGVKKILFIGSSCIYPKLAKQPMDEAQLLTGKLENTNEPYAIAKIAGIKLCESYNRQYGESHGIDYRSVMPTNLYGPGDNYHPENSHVIPALIRRFHEAKRDKSKVIKVWGSGTPLREFLHVNDMAAASIFVMNLPKPSFEAQTNSMQNHLNVGSGIEITIRELSEAIANVVEYQGSIEYDTSKPDGTPRKLLDSNRLNNLGWQFNVNLVDGLKTTYKNFLETGAKEYAR